MTDRRRNFFILLLVGALLAGSVALIAAKKTREGLDLKGGVELVYQAKPTKFSQVTVDAMSRTIDIMRERVDHPGDVWTEPQFLKTHQKAPKPGQSIIAVQPGTTVVEAEYDKNAPKNTVAGNNAAQWFVLNDNFALRGTDITDPAQTFDNGTGGT